jgi:outer membrane protein assembly factor BamB
MAPRCPQPLPVLIALLAASIAGAAAARRRSHDFANGPLAVSLPGPGSTSEPPAVPPTEAASATFVARVAAPTEPSRTFRGDRGRRHRAAFSGPAASPRARFVWDAGGPIETMPAITENGDVVVASLSGRVARLSPEGTTKWAVELGERVYASPLLLGETLVVGSDAKRVIALSLASGKKRWELAVEGEADTAAAETPDGALVIAAGRVLYGLRADGAVRYRVTIPRKVYASPAIADDGTVYVGAQDHRLYAISPRGVVAWSRDLGGDVDCAPALGDDGTVYAASDAGQVFAFDALGNERWRANVGGFIRGGLTVSRSGTVFAGTYGPGPRVVALDGASGAERWTFRIQGTGAPEFGIHGAPLEDPEGNLYFGTQDDLVYALDAAGHLRWSFATQGDVDAPLAIGPTGVLYAGSDDGHLYALY